MAHGVIIGGVGTDESDVQDMGPGAVTGELPSLKQTSEMIRKQITSFNEYKPTNQYSGTHPNAQSDGDEHGKGDGGNNTVGTLKDIQTKNTELYSSGNKYKPGNGYDNFDFPEQYW